MRALFAILAALLMAAALHAQPQGLAPEWDVRRMLDSLIAETGKLEPILNQVRPKDWVADGAPQTYVAQFDSLRVQNKAVAQAAKNLQQKPAELVPLLQLVFRIQAFDVALHSVEEGLRKYQNPSLADLLIAVVAEGVAPREHLQQYALEVATEREQQCSVADREAQRCRESISKSPRSNK